MTAGSRAGGGGGGSLLVLATELPRAGGGRELAAAAATALAAGRQVVLADLGGAPKRPTLLASAEARALEDALRARGHGAAARGRICWLALPGGEAGAEALAGLRELGLADLIVAYVPPSLWAEALDRLDPGPDGALLRAELPAQRALAALAVAELRERGVPAQVAKRGPGLVAARRAAAGIEPGGPAGAAARRLTRRLLGRGSAGRGGSRDGAAPPARAAPSPAPAPPPGEAGQALILALGAAFATLACALALAAIGGALTGATRVQRAADLAALSGARSLRDDMARLLAPARLPGGAPNPAHLERSEYLGRARSAAEEAAERNGLSPRAARVSFPDRGALVPVRVRVEVLAGVAAPGRREVPVAAAAEAEAAPPAAWSGTEAMASGGGYAGPLAYRQGEPMRPDVAAAFDRMAAAARADGVALAINSAYRSDAEQARLFAANPDPRWVAPPGRSLHRCATELDLGPSSAYAWLAANAGRFGFARRYAWEPWHYGFTQGPPPCSAAGNATGPVPDGAAARAGLPGFVPAPFRAPILAAAARWNVSAGLLAAQLMAESGFDPRAVSPAGAAGIAQFMPATAASYGLADPFDAPRAIEAQAHLMADLLRRFGSVPLALAAYDAGPAAVAACGCVPAIAETQAYVARILGLMDAAGELALPAPLEVRLVA